MSAAADREIVSYHAEQRALDHFGLRPSPSDWLDVVAQITDRPPRALLMWSHQRSNGLKERWLVRLCGQQVTIIWAPDSNPLIVTVLAREYAHASPQVEQMLKRPMRTQDHDAPNRPARRGNARLRAEMMAEAAE